jgi:tetratricopeptide (TPR) repeat protein
LSSNFEKQLKQVDQLIIHGKFKEAHKMINDGLKSKKISKKGELRFLVHKSELEFYFGNFDESIRLANLVLKEDEGLDTILLTVDALTWKAVSLFWNGKISEYLVTIEKGLTTISTVKKLPVKAIAKRKVQLLSWKSLLTNLLGDFEKGLELAKEALSLAEESGYRNIISLSLIMLGGTYLFLDETKKCEEHSKKALDIAIELGNKFHIAFSYALGLVRVKRRRREYEQTLDLLRKVFDLTEEIGCKFLFVSKNDMGLVYRDMFQLDKALECFQEALKHSEFLKHTVFMNIGYTYFLKYDLVNAQEYYFKSMKINEEMKDRFILPVNLYYLVLLSLELKNLTQAKKYLKRLEHISNETGFERIGRTYHFASILILKASGKISDLIAEEDLPSFWRLDALYSLLEIRIKELQLSTTVAALTEVKKQAIRLEVEAEEQKLQWLLADVYRLHSQLALVALDIKGAIEFLEKAQLIAEEINVELLKERIKTDQEKIEQQHTVWNKLQEQKAPIGETVKLVSLESTVKNIKKDTILEERDEETGKIIEYRKLFALKL